MQVPRLPFPKMIYSVLINLKISLIIITNSINIEPSASSFSGFDATISLSWQRSRACQETNMNIRFNRKEKNGYASNKVLHVLKNRVAQPVARTCHISSSENRPVGSMLLLTVPSNSTGSWGITPKRDLRS